MRNSKVNVMFMLIFQVSITCLVSCKADHDDLEILEPLARNVVLEVTIDSVEADNSSFAIIKATLNDELQGENFIEFIAENGTFHNGSNVYEVFMGPNNDVNALLRSNESGVIRVTANIFNSYSDEVFVNFVPAYPELIAVNIDSTSINASYQSTTQLKSSLLRSVGQVSQGLNVSYYDSVATTEGGSVGAFQNASFTDENGESTAQYWLQDTSYHGVVFLKSKFESDSGTVIGMNQLFIE